MKILNDEMKRKVRLSRDSGITLSNYTVGLESFEHEDVYELAYFINKDFDLELGGYCVERCIAGLTRTASHGLSYKGLPAGVVRAPFLASHKPEPIEAISTIYEAAYSFIYENSLCLRNQDKRNQVHAFLDPEFKNAASEILVSDMDGIGVESIQIMSDRDCNELWKNTVWFAASCGIIEASYTGHKFDTDKKLQEKYAKPDFNIF